MLLDRQYLGVPLVTLVVGMGLVLFALGVAAAVLQVQSASSIPATPAIDPRFIIHPKTTQLRVSLSPGLLLSGSLSPSIPGENTIHLAPRGQDRGLRNSASITLVATMPGMAMVPQRARLVPDGHGYTGSISLPMFGRYRVLVQMAGKKTVMNVGLPLPRL